MKKWIAFLLVVTVMLSGCHAVIANPPATEPSATVTEPAMESLPETSTYTEPPVQPEEDTTPSEPPAEAVPEIPLGGGICDTCGNIYGSGEGFEHLCYNCQEKYGPKCSVCGTDCTYRGTIEGMCDDCWENEQTEPCTLCGQECVGTWIDTFYVCQSCAQTRPCAICGTQYYFWDMFEGVCFACDDPSDGMADMAYCCVCGTMLYEDGNYDGYCYYCHPDFGFTCTQCGSQWPAHRTESGLCPQCEAGE